jgi:hypothetical protein
MPYEDDFFLRTDMLPNRLYRYDGARWVKVEDKVRHTLTNSDTRQTLKTGFINNVNITGTTVVQEGIDVPTVATTVISTTVPYTAKMGAKVMIGDEKVAVATVTADNLGNAKITMSSTAPISSSVSWTLYQSFIDERSSISKALKPKADL